MIVSTGLGVLSLTPDELWSLTYYEFCQYLTGYESKINQGMAESWWTAHLTAVGYHSPKKFPELKSILIKHEAPKKKEKTKQWLDTLPKKRKAKT